MDITERVVKSENIKVYNSLAKHYDKLHPEVWNWYEQLRYKKYVKMSLETISNFNQPLILDVGAGTGNLSIKYLRAGCKVISSDISNEMLRMLDGKLTDEERNRCNLIHTDIEALVDAIDQIDGVCFSSVLHHIFNYEDLVKKITSKLKNGGFFFSIHDPLIQQPKSKIRFKLHRVIGRLDEYIYLHHAKKQGYDLKKDFPDDTIAEFHQHGGTFNHAALLELLEASGIKQIHFETYTSRRYGVFSWLSTKIIRSENSFAFLGIKQ